MKKLQAQINPSEYRDLDYLAKPRWINIWHQIKEVENSHASSILEVGIGNGLVTHILKMLGKEITTVDFDRRLSPDVVADVRKLPFRSNNFDCVVCAEVLEHIPFSDVKKALSELYRVTRRTAIITLPQDYLTYFLFKWKLLPFMKPVVWFTLIPRFRHHVFDGQHYWEIGKRGYKAKRIIHMLTQVGFTLTKTYCLPEDPEHKFFIVKKI